MNADRLMCQCSSLVTAHADVESQLGVCARPCVSLSCSVSETPPCPASLVYPELWHRGSCWFSEACRKFSLSAICCHYLLNDSSWIPLRSTFPSPSQGQAALTPRLLRAECEHKLGAL